MAKVAQTLCLPDESELRRLINENGSVCFGGFEWFLSDDGLHYRSLEEIDGVQLELGINIPFNADSLFGGN